MLEHLRQLTVDNPEQQRRMPVLAAALEDYLAQRQQTVDIYTQEGLSAVQRVVRSRAHLDTLHTLDGMIDAAIDTERDLLSQRQERAARGERRVGEVALLSGAIDCGFLAAGVWLTVLAFRSARHLTVTR